MSRTIFREAKRRGRRIPRSGVRQFVAGHFVAVIGSFHVKSEEGFCRRDEIRRRRSVAVVEKSTTTPALMGGVRFTANRGHCQYDKLSQVNLDQKKASRSREQETL